MNNTNYQKITIGLPVYNGQKFIRRRLDSILNQTYSNFELLISDNASIDSTWKICQEYADKDNRIILYRQQENQGVHSNFKFVLEKSSANYFVWAAIDDLWNPNFLRKNMENLLSKKNVVGSVSKVKIFTDLEVMNSRKKIKRDYLS